MASASTLQRSSGQGVGKTGPMFVETLIEALENTMLALAFGAATRGALL